MDGVYTRDAKKPGSIVATNTAVKNSGDNKRPVKFNAGPIHRPGQELQHAAYGGWNRSLAADQENRSRNWFSRQENDFESSPGSSSRKNASRSLSAVRSFPGIVPRSSRQLVYNYQSSPKNATYKDRKRGGT